MSRRIRVLVVDDDGLLRQLVTGQLKRAGYAAAAAHSGHEALRMLGEQDYDVMLLDIRMPEMNGLQALRLIRQMEDAPEVVMLTADNALTTGLEAMRLGAYDYLTKPSTLEEMEAVIRKAEEKRRLVRQNASLRAVVQQSEDENIPVIIYRSAAMRALVAQAEAAAQHDSTILITGESGTGKDVLARYIHAKSARARNALITVNCGALPESLFESEFFGHERGSFTGATALKRGLLEAADGSTLFLDEVGEMPLAAQVKLLRFLEEGSFRRIGATRDRQADARVMAATNRNLEEDVRAARFRADLFYRLNVVSLHLPPLRERPEDIPALVEHFLALLRQRFNRPGLELAAEARQRLEDFRWPGNARELRNTLERAVALSTADLITAEGILPANRSEPTTQQPAPPALPLTLAEVERGHILRVLEEAGGNRERAAAILGISVRTLYRKLREYE